MFTYLCPRLLTIRNQPLSSIVSCSVQGVRTFEYKWQNPIGLALRGTGALSLSLSNLACGIPCLNQEVVLYCSVGWEMKSHSYSHPMRNAGATPCYGSLRSNVLASNIIHWSYSQWFIFVLVTPSQKIKNNYFGGDYKRCAGQGSEEAHDLVRKGHEHI